MKLPPLCRRAWPNFLAACCLAVPQIQGASTSDANSAEDPYIWLEEVTGEKALDWVKQQNAISTRELEAMPEFEPIRQRLLSILDSRERIPFVTKHGPHLYNFWRDDKNPRGLWRRTSLEEYKKPNPKWETVIDLDHLAKAENENWVWKRSIFLEPSDDRALLALSRGGADATVIREFDVVRKEFVKDGFFVPEAKTAVAWRNRDTLYVGTDFGPGSLTKSGYARLVKEWRRGTPLAQARLVEQATEDDMMIAAYVAHDHGKVYEFIVRRPTFFTEEVMLRRGDEWVRIDKPADVELSTFDDYFLFTLRTDWKIGGKTYAGGSLLAAKVNEYLNGKGKMLVLFEPTERTSLASVSATKSYVILNTLDNVRSVPIFVEIRDGQLRRSRPDSPEFGTVSVYGLDPDESDQYFMTEANFLTPSTLYLGTKEMRQKLKQLPAFFDADGLEIQQFEARSKDGTRVPYFQVSRKGMKLDGQNPTLLYGYGGFELPQLPGYSPGVGSAWLERGGVYVLANIRGGGEFGPRWHQAARKQNRQRAYDDFIAVAEDLHKRKVTSPKHLGIQGGSNGGLLMGVMFTQRPDLFGAVVCQVPLLDMRRYNKLLAGASWMDEYGNPDLPEEWAFIRKYSPYQNVARDEKYPRILFTTSTRDDRVHPGHARKMVARMKEYGHDVLYYENIEGGHGGSANNEQAAYMQALAYSFLLKELR